MTADTDHVSQRAGIERQRRLPLTKAVEISLKAIRVRFWRSMLTVSSIILAIAFLMWQLTSAEIVRALDEVAQDPARVDADAAYLGERADRLEAEADRVAKEQQPILDAFDTAQRRLEAGKALAAVASAEGRLREARQTLTQAVDRINEAHIVAARDDYETLDKELQRLKRRLRIVPPADPQYKELDGQRASLEQRLGRQRSTYKEYLKRRTTHEQAEGLVRDAERRLAAAQEAAAEARQAFPQQAPAPEDSDEGGRLLQEFETAKRARDRAQKRIDSAQSGAESARKQHEGASHKALRELLARKGEQSADSEAAVRQEWFLPLGLRLTPTRLWIITLALLVCLVGITNAMLMSVTERYREIGTMKCLGALDSFIVKIFLLESSFMGLIGVVLGMVLGFVLAFLVQWRNFGGFATRYFPAAGIVKWAVVAFVVGAVLSVLGGILPAQRAARMTPVDAMRIEE